MTHETEHARQESAQADGMSLIRQSETGQPATLSTRLATDGEIPMTATAVRPIWHEPQPVEGQPTPAGRRYLAAMTSANAVITAIDARKPGMKPAKQHLLLFFAQGHHVAWSGEPLFGEPMAATDRGVTVEIPAAGGADIADEAPLNTIGYVVMRYAALSPADLRTLIQASQPWQAATKPGAGQLIDLNDLRDWFRRPDETDDPDDERPNRAEMAEAEAYLASRGRR